MSEDRLQSEVIKYIRYQYPKIRYCASAGGVYTGISQARKMVRNGYVKDFQIYLFMKQEMDIMDWQLN